MIVTTTIDLSVKTYRYFLHEAQKCGITPELYISRYLEACAADEHEKSDVSEVSGQDKSPLI